MIHTKVHIHYAKVPVIAVFHLQNPYSFVDVTYEEKKKKKSSARETNQGEMEKTPGPVRGCF